MMILPLGKIYFYPRPPRGGRPGRAIRARLQQLISIHALREEGDPDYRESRGAMVISIHALREEGDVGCSWRIS